MDNNEKLKLARDWYNDQSTTKKEKVLLENLFPELKESEDEKVRKALIKYYSFDEDESLYALGDFTPKQIVAWLEKQGDYNKLVEEIKERKKLISKEKEKATSSNDKLSLGGRIAILEELLAFTGNKQGEQKPADKVESKFKVGDWIVYNDTNVYQVKEIDYTNIIPRYELENIDRDKLSIPLTSDYNLRNWTIQDAKDGDVLANNAGAIFINADIGSDKGRVTLDCYCYLSVQNEFCIEEYKTGSWFYKNDIKPATKEQCELLFSKMKEAGYEWNADEKVLVMIGVDNDEEDERYEELMEDDEASIKQNPAWSEEDENKCMWIVRLIGTARFSELESDKMPCDRNELIKWLKSLKPQSHWKPTEEQMKALERTIRLANFGLEEDRRKALESILEQLKKL